MSRPRFNPAIHDRLMATIDQMISDHRDVNFASVARAAGHARGLISKEHCPYAAVRERILSIRSAEQVRIAATQRKSRQRSVDDPQVSELVAENRALRLVVDELSSALAASIVAAKVTATAGAEGGQKEDLEKRLAARKERAAAEALM